MSDRAKIVFGALASLVVGFISAVIGYHVRDSFDAPRLQIEKSRYRITRKRCALTAEQFYRFRTARTLIDALEMTVPWSVAADVRDAEFEYDHVEDLIRQLPPRKEQLTRELTYTSALQAGVQQFLAQDTLETRDHVRRTIAFVAGLQSEATNDGSSAGGNDRLLSMYADFEEQPQLYATTLLRSITGQVNKLRNEIGVIDAVLPEFKMYYDQGRPPALPFVGNDIAKLPNVEFIVTVSNTGRTDGQVSYRALFRSGGADPYEVKLVGQNPRLHLPLSPHYYALVEQSKLDELVYGIDRVSNTPDVVRRFYTSVSSSEGLVGTFIMSSLQGDELRYPVRQLQPYN